MAHAKGSIKPMRGKLKEIRVKHAGNGFLVSKHHEPPAGMAPMEPDPAPQVFQKGQVGALHKHLRQATSEMHPPEAGEATSGQMQGYEPEEQQS